MPAGQTASGRRTALACTLLSRFFFVVFFFILLFFFHPFPQSIGFARGDRESGQLLQRRDTLRGIAGDEECRR